MLPEYLSGIAYPGEPELLLGQSIPVEVLAVAEDPRPVELRLVSLLCVLALAILVIVVVVAVNEVLARSSTAWALVLTSSDLVKSVGEVDLIGHSDQLLALLLLAVGCELSSPAVLVVLHIALLDCILLQVDLQLFSESLPVIFIVLLDIADDSLFLSLISFV